MVNEYINRIIQGGKIVEQLAGMLTNLKAEVLEPVIVKGYPTAEDFKALDNLADKIQLNFGKNTKD